jgi:hypothetical protein
VHYDAAVTHEAALREAVRECGYHCRGEMRPDHLCKFAEPDPHTAHAKHAAQPGTKDEMAHEMGHGAGMDMAGMVPPSVRSSPRSRCREARSSSPRMRCSSSARKSEG